MAPRVCPWWLGYFLISPLRKFAHDPHRIVGPYIRAGMTVVDFGCGMGYFSLPIAEMVGPAGRVVCVDVQDRMLAGLLRRAAKAGLNERIEPVRATPDDSGLGGLAGAVDFILAMFVLHEVQDTERLLRDFAASLKPGGKMLAAEPVGHVREAAFLQTVATAERAGLSVVDRPHVRRARAALFIAAGTPPA